MSLSDEGFWGPDFICGTHAVRQGITKWAKPAIKKLVLAVPHQDSTQLQTVLAWR
jgi:hypothetical protein